jgi:hypothetical protein
MDAELHDRFVAEIERMSPDGLKRYQGIVGGLIIERVLRTLTMRELKWLYSSIERKRKSMSGDARGVAAGESVTNGSSVLTAIDLNIE